ncbi:hypothetical protein HJC23_009998 [Cyclotella cryptica]|uniref:protein-L-isoaspartate(D-aspartate) O-methyltransferase n=1 Tax=Cyclotella cryptica TaxID=29204 RepID=A0ABD3Q8N3_9STRA|eukprot:CCRYP_007772-RA/>CCRYP_007772-RA protein AED:0.06 eAED:0.06 QI:214/1/1/1/1/1/3/641/332
MTSPRMTQPGHYNNQHSPKFCCIILFRFLLLLFPRQVSSAPLTISTSTCAAETNSLAYVHNNSHNQEPRKLMRAWMCHGRTHREMIDKLASAGIVKSPVNIEALLKVDRKNYVLNKDYAYEDSPQPIGYGATISAPHMHAHVLEDLLPPLMKASHDNPEKPLRILDVGCGSGYLTAVFGRMVERKPKSMSHMNILNDGKVFGIDVVPQLVELSRKNILKEDRDLLDSGIVEVMTRDGWKGYPEGGPYNAIHVGAAAETFPKELMKQMALGGVMVIPVGPDGGIQYLYRVERVGDAGDIAGVNDSKGFHEDDFKAFRVLGVRYVPLVRAESRD